MRVVYDTSVLVTIVSRRNLILLLQADVMLGKVSMVTSSYILDELERVLTSKLHMTKQQAKTRANLVSRVADLVRPKSIIPVSRDIKDDPMLATAITGTAEYLVTLDKDLLILKRHLDIQILRPEDFTKVIASLD